MEYLFIDSNNFISCALLEEITHSPELIDKLFEVIASNNIKLLLPEIIEIELYRKVDSTYFQIEKAVKGFIKRLSSDFPSLLNKDKGDFIKAAEDILKNRTAAKTRAMAKISSLFDSSNVIRIKLNSEIMINAFKRALSGRKPYKYSYCVECKELSNLFDSDCLIFESLLHQLSELNGRAKLVFCSDNINDFAEFDKKMKSHVLFHDLLNDLPKGISVKYYRHFAEALNSEYSAKIKKTDIREIENISKSISLQNSLYQISNDADKLGKSMASQLLACADSLKSSQGGMLDCIKSIQQAAMLENIKSAQFGLVDYMKSIQQSGITGIANELARVRDSVLLDSLRIMKDINFFGPAKDAKEIDKLKKEDEGKGNK